MGWYNPSLGGGSAPGVGDGKIGISSGDTTLDFAINKLLAGKQISITKGNAGANETLTFDVNGIPCISVANILNPVELASIDADTYNSCAVIARQARSGDTDYVIVYINDGTPWVSTIAPYVMAGANGTQWIASAGSYMFMYGLYNLGTTNSAYSYNGIHLGKNQLATVNQQMLGYQFTCTEFVGGTYPSSLDKVPTSEISQGMKARVLKNGVWEYTAISSAISAEQEFAGARGYKIITPDTDDSSKPNLRWVCTHAHDSANNKIYDLLAWKNDNSARQVWMVRWNDNDNNSIQYEYSGTTTSYSFIEMLRTTYLSITLPLVDFIQLNGSGSIRGLDPAIAATYAMTYGQRAVGGRTTKFRYVTLTAGMSSVQLFSVDDLVQYELAIRNGSLTGISLALPLARTAGSVTIEPTINGTPVTSSLLDLTINTNTDFARANVSPGTTNLTFTAEQKLGIQATTSADFAPVGAGSGAVVTLEFVYNGS